MNTQKTEEVWKSPKECFEQFLVTKFVTNLERHRKLISCWGILWPQLLRFFGHSTPTGTENRTEDSTYFLEVGSKIGTANYMWEQLCNRRNLKAECYKWQAASRLKLLAVHLATIFAAEKHTEERMSPAMHKFLRCPTKLRYLRFLCEHVGLTFGNSDALDLSSDIPD